MVFDSELDSCLLKEVGVFLKLCWFKVFPVKLAFLLLSSPLNTPIDLLLTQWHEAIYLFICDDIMLFTTWLPLTQSTVLRRHAILVCCHKVRARSSQSVEVFKAGICVTTWFCLHGIVAAFVSAASAHDGGLFVPQIVAPGWQSSSVFTHPPAQGRAVHCLIETDSYHQAVILSPIWE